MHLLTVETIESYMEHLSLEEYSYSTVEKYRRDIWSFYQWLKKDKAVSKEILTDWKQSLQNKQYAVATINAKIVAVNSLMAFLGWQECRVKALKQQKRIFSDQSKELSREEYLRLVKTAKSNGKERLMLVIQTICATGIRVSELQYITVEAVREGYAEVDCKNKHRLIFLPQKLRKLLLEYSKKQNIGSGTVFVTKSGRPLNRSNIWHDMKGLCKAANVDAKKVFPHNLRHLFARTFYALEKDIAKLADLLGHASIETTRIYIMESGETHRKRLERMRLII